MTKTNQKPADLEIKALTEAWASAARCRVRKMPQDWRKAETEIAGNGSEATALLFRV